ncbi:MAG: polyprenyl diphosphate synthase [Candidatus Dependentiae bacterium]|nr:polyprenyl diphosphate synthase [Candidatus Dependentiae bacterium]
MKKIHRIIFIGLVVGLPLAVFLFKQPPQQMAQKSAGGEKKELKHRVKHLGLIMDGNRRWAKQNGLSELEGHTKGCEPVRTAVRFCVDQKIPHLTLYAFSLENFKRSAEELDHIFSLVEPGLSGEEFDELISHGVRIRFVGDRSRVPARLHQTIQRLEEKTAQGDALNLNILFCYGGRQEIVAAVKSIAHKIARGQLAADQITEESFGRELWSSHSPALDLVIRTGDDQRLSNFMLWHSAYGELVFLEKYWPEITYDDLYNAIADFMQRQRRFGK